MSFCQGHHSILSDYSEGPQNSGNRGKPKAQMETQGEPTAKKCKATTHKRPFSVEEDHKLMQLLSTGTNKSWAVIASCMDGRTAKQCRERWNGHLNPTVNKGPWTSEEDRILEEKQKELGNKWARIAQYLPGRTDTLVKNRWNTYIQRKSMHSSVQTKHKVELPSFMRTITPIDRVFEHTKVNHFLSSPVAAIPPLTVKAG